MVDLSLSTAALLICRSPTGCLNVQFDTYYGPEEARKMGHAYGGPSPSSCPNVPPSLATLHDNTDNGDNGDNTDNGNNSQPGPHRQLSLGLSSPATIRSTHQRQVDGLGSPDPSQYLLVLHSGRNCGRRKLRDERCLKLAFTSDQMSPLAQSLPPPPFLSAPSTV